MIHKVFSFEACISSYNFLNKGTKPFFNLVKFNLFWQGFLPHFKATFHTLPLGILICISKMDCSTYSKLSKMFNNSSNNLMFRENRIWQYGKNSLLIWPSYMFIHLCHFEISVFLDYRSFISITLLNLMPILCAKVLFYEFGHCMQV